LRYAFGDSGKPSPGFTEFRRNPCQIRGSEFEHLICQGAFKVILTFKIGESWKQE
jgi:hypothetical protein